MPYIVVINILIILFALFIILFLYDSTLNHNNLKSFKLISFSIVIIAIGIILYMYSYKNERIKLAETLMETKDYSIASSIFLDIGENEKYQETINLYAQQLYNDGKYEEAKEIFGELLGYDEYRDSAQEYLEKIRLSELSLELENTYQKANTAYYDRNYRMALEYFTSILDYKDSSKMVVICKNAQTKYNTISAGSLFSMGIKENGNMVLVTEFPNKNWTVAAKWKDSIMNAFAMITAMITILQFHSDQGLSL